MLALTAARVLKANGAMYRKLELDDMTLQRGSDAMAAALLGGHALTRNELRDVLESAAIPAPDGLRLVYLLMYAELEGVICSGARRGKQFTYALMAERAVEARRLDHDEAIAELAQRYLLSRGPATIYDLAKWSGLTVAEAREGVERVRDGFESEKIDGRTYWFADETASDPATAPAAHLLSVYDEYVSSYKDHGLLCSADVASRLSELGNAVSNLILLNGAIVGRWKCTFRRREVVIETDFFVGPPVHARSALRIAASRYGAFLGLEPVLL